MFQGVTFSRRLWPEILQDSQGRRFSATSLSGNQLVWGEDRAGGWGDGDAMPRWDPLVQLELFSISLGTAQAAVHLSVPPVLAALGPPRCLAGHINTF